MSEEALRKLALSVRNRGRWGPDDEIGTLNYITRRVTWDASSGLLRW